MLRSVSAEGLAFIERLEGFRAEPLALPNGGWVIGFNHVRADAPGNPIDHAQARSLLQDDLAAVEALLAEHALVPLSQMQIDALASFAFSVGADAFVHSDVLKRVNAGEPIAAAIAMASWRKSALAGEPQIYDVLVRRRTAEAALFLSTPTPIGAPSALLRPQLDHAAAILSAPGPVADLPASIAPADGDEIARRLTAILARESATVHALSPPPAPQADAFDQEPALDPVAQPTDAGPDITGLALVCFVGALLLFGGLLAYQRGAEAVFLILSPLGAVMLGMGVWGLMRDTHKARR
jgi:lysozyme